uniref:Uncharacterized protein n=1 Tax=Arundo donax TaxID=35708 RepID=A0A0A9GF32_ARUDO
MRDGMTLSSALPSHHCIEVVTGHGMPKF